MLFLVFILFEIRSVSLALYFDIFHYFWKSLAIMSLSVYSVPFSLSTPSRKQIVCVRMFGVFPQLLDAVSLFVTIINVVMMMSPHVSV